MSRGEVGRVGVPIAHLGDMRALFDGIPLEPMNTSMTINATAPWLLALYVCVAEEQGSERARWPARRRTTSSRSSCPGARTRSRRGRRCGSPRTSSRGPTGRCRDGTRSTCVLPPAGGGRGSGAGGGVHHGQRRRRPGRHPSRRAGSPTPSSPPWSAGSRSSATRASGSSKRPRSSGRWPGYGTGWRASATAWRIRGCAGSGTACR